MNQRNTIRLSDTVDSYERKVHINVRNGKVTMVYRWKDRYSDKKHTQRTTMNDDQTEHLLSVLERMRDKIAEQSEEV